MSACISYKGDRMVKEVCLQPLTLAAGQSWTANVSEQNHTYFEKMMDRLVATNVNKIGCLSLSLHKSDSNHLDYYISSGNSSYEKFRVSMSCRVYLFELCRVLASN